MNEQKLWAALAACCVFWAELAAGKTLLPACGGSIMGWGLALIFFQTTLLVGYWASKRLAVMPHARWIVGVLAASGALIQTSPAGTGTELYAALRALVPWGGIAAGLFATTPLLQARQRDPSDYRIYSWSNAGALFGLASYPTLVEPWVDLWIQKWVVVGGALAVALIGLRARGKATAPAQAQVAPGWRWEWLILPAVSSATCMTTTNQLSMEIASGPLAWTLPLGLFLGTYVYAFGRKEAHGINLILAGVGLVATIASLQTVDKIGLTTTLVAGTLAMLACHLRLAVIKPAESSRFYLLNGLGGLLGTSTIVFVAPLLSGRLIEVPLLFIGAIMWGVLRNQRPERARWVVATGTALLAVAIYLSTPESNVTKYRSWYGGYTVSEWQDRIILQSGTTMHGVESREGFDRIWGYYSHDSGIGQVIRDLQNTTTGFKATLIGLGIGSLYNYARPTDQFEYLELDPLVERIARQRFRALKPETKVHIGDGRRLLAAQDGPLNDLIVVDAFSGDAIPCHLLTREAGDLYRRRLAKDGVLAIHITNRHLDLRAVTENLALSMGARYQLLEEGRSSTNFYNKWAVLLPGGEPKPAPGVWTDQRNSLWGHIRYR